MDTKTYDNVTVRKEKDSVIFIDAEHCFPMKRSTFRAIVCANVREVSKPWEDNATTAIDSTTLEV